MSTWPTPRLATWRNRRLPSWKPFSYAVLNLGEAEGYTLLREMGLRAVQPFRTTWKDGGLAKKKKQERLTGFFWFCIRAGWITTTPTLNLKRITVHQKPTDYFPREEYKKIIEATHCLDDGLERVYDVEKRGQRIRALVQLLRWSGLRIRDAVTLEKARLQANDDLFLYQAKTSVPVYIPLPHDVAEELRNMPPRPKPKFRYLFWSGNGEAKSAVADLQRSFRRLFEVAKLAKADGTAKRCFPHMFRDTLADDEPGPGYKCGKVKHRHQTKPNEENRYADEYDCHPCCEVEAQLGPRTIQRLIEG